MYNNDDNQTYYPNNNMMYQNNDNIQYMVDERGFLIPFVLGGITGGLVAPAFYGGYGRPQYYQQQPMYPCYGPYCYRK